MCLTDWIVSATSDGIWFPMVQAALVVFAVIAFAFDWAAGRRAGRGGVTLTLTRSPASMAFFYGAYAALTGIYVALSLAVDMAADHRVFWVLLDTLLVAYMCLKNHWFRNKLIGVSIELTKEGR